ncbi:hypothetical protein PUR61_28005 [Streptomyces sp. BE20]|uniref:hypothetical protein n=1 Tax=Streptomyces sp. BE20 TaxID=3002525 RepID=UPI002E7693A9|nr:hypothetical protein [Streptomyces sp. BE20]MEE1826008.1 hypothetical protein [Streptomyces sp. BE20]
MLAAAGLAQLSMPGAGRAAPASAAADEHAEVLAALDERARALTAGPPALPVRAVYRNLLLGPVDPAGRCSATAELAVTVTGYDEQPVVYPRRLTLAGSAGDRRVEREEGLDGPPPLWDLGAVRAAAGEHCLVLGPADPPALAELAAAGDRAVPAVEALWGSDWAGRLLFHLPATEEQFARLVAGGSPGWSGMAAVTVAAPGAPRRAPADRIVVNPGAYGRLSDFGRQVVTTHEAVHVATRADTRAWTPLWLSEGVADWTGYRDSGRPARRIAPELARDVAAGRVPVALPGDGDFTAGAGGIAQAYEQAWLACDLIARRYGPQRLVALYRAVGEAGPGADREAWLDGLLRDGLGLGLAEFTRLWLTEVRGLAG